MKRGAGLHSYAGRSFIKGDGDLCCRIRLKLRISLKKWSERDMFIRESFAVVKVCIELLPRGLSIRMPVVLPLIRVL